MEHGLLPHLLLSKSLPQVHPSKSLLQVECGLVRGVGALDEALVKVLLGGAFGGAFPEGSQGGGFGFFGGAGPPRIVRTVGEPKPGGGAAGFLPLPPVGGASEPRDFFEVGDQAGGGPSVDPNPDVVFGFVEDFAGGEDVGAGLEDCEVCGQPPPVGGDQEGVAGPRVGPQQGQEVPLQGPHAAAPHRLQQRGRELEAQPGVQGALPQQPVALEGNAGHQQPPPPGGQSGPLGGQTALLLSSVLNATHNLGKQHAPNMSNNI